MDSFLDFNRLVRTLKDAPNLAESTRLAAHFLSRVVESADSIVFFLRDGEAAFKVQAAVGDEERLRQLSLDDDSPLTWKAASPASPIMPLPWMGSCGLPGSCC